MSHYEYFLDQHNLDQLSTVSLQVHTPTKYASNPVLGNAAWTYDRDINYVMPWKIGSTLYMWYVGVSAGPNVYTCYATSTDGISFTRPNLGLVSYGGNTNNNILFAEKTQGEGVYYNASLSPAYYLAGEAVNGQSQFGCYLWTSSNGTSWTLVKTLFQSSADGNYKEGRQIIRRDDGRWLFIYMHGGIMQRRQAGAYLSDTTDVTGSWTDIGVFVDSSDQDEQIYHFQQHELGGGLRLAVAPNYNKTTEQIDKLRLYVSRDNYTWRLVTSDWLSIGTAGQWDDEMIIPAMPMIQFDNEWRMYYTGFPEDHAAGLPREARVGYCHIGYGRIGGVASTGYVRTKAITVGASEALTVNANASGGSVQAQLFDASTGNPVENYTLTESSTVSSDTYSTEITWGGNSIPAGTYKIRFFLENATLYSFEVS